MKIFAVLILACSAFVIQAHANPLPDCTLVDGKPTCVVTPDLQSTPGDPVPMPKDYWDVKNTTGAVAFSVDGKIQAFVFISTDGKRMIMSAETAAKNERARTLLMALMELGHLDNAAYHSGCTTMEDQAKLDRFANPPDDKLEGKLEEGSPQ